MTCIAINLTAFKGHSQLQIRQLQMCSKADAKEKGYKTRTIASMSADIAAAMISPEAIVSPLATAAKLTEPPMYDAAKAETIYCETECRLQG